METSNTKNSITETEKKWLSYWEKEKIYKFNPKSKKKIYSIDMPPPTVSGKMHIGHAFSYAQEDFIARYKRMKGFEVFYPFGTDDNGLPTERLVEKLKNVRSKAMSREEFIKLCLRTLKEISPTFIQEWKNIGMSCDFDIYYSTIDENSCAISQKYFIELYKKGLIYREKFPTIYCPECQTPIAQAELEDKEKDSKFNTIKFSVGGESYGKSARSSPAVNSPNSNFVSEIDEKNSGTKVLATNPNSRADLLIATTRPELIGACVAVFVNPKDKRYENLIGKKARVPLYEHEVEIIGDESAAMDKGTGALMVCSYGDKYDVDAVKKYKLKPRVIFGANGRLNDFRYQGLTIKQARVKILEDLQKKNLIVEQKDIRHAVNVHDKCGTEIEFLPVEQWFVKILENKMKLIEQGKKIKWYPKHMFKRYENWILGLEWDWSISRDRHFGIPIPFWSCEKCGSVVLPSEKELPIDPIAVGEKKCKKCGGKAIPENKVIDTWGTSSLTPMIASSLVGNAIKLPYSLRPQAHDLIRTWAFYTIVRAFYHENKIPWNEIAISGFVGLGGEKMSKSKGNVIEPQKVVEQYGADAIRYWAASSKLGEDLDYMEKDLIAGKKFVTKILNAANFLFSNLKDCDGKKPAKLVETDRLFLSQLNEVIESCTRAFDEYNYSKAKMEVDNFFWKVFADNYLEIVKCRVYNGSSEEKASAFWSLYQTLFAIVKLFAPFTPFICEEVYQSHFKKFEKEKSVHLLEWPLRIGISSHRSDAKIWNKFVEIIGKVRQAKSEFKIAMNAKIYLTLTASDLKELEEVLEDLKGVCCVEGKIEKGEFEVRVV